MDKVYGGEYSRFISFRELKIGDTFYYRDTSEERIKLGNKYAGCTNTHCYYPVSDVNFVVEQRRTLPMILDDIRKCLYGAEIDDEKWQILASELNYFALHRGYSDMTKCYGGPQEE